MIDYLHALTSTAQKTGTKYQQILVKSQAMIVICKVRNLINEFKKDIGDLLKT